MPKVMKSKLIHLLGGYTYEELDDACTKHYVMGSNDNQYEIWAHFDKLEKDNYGKDKQQWIDVIHNAIDELQFKLNCLSRW